MNLFDARPAFDRATGGRDPLLIALSGGGDSVALMHLCAEHIGAARLRAIVVDHALRTGSAADALRAKAFADALGVAAEIVTLVWPHGPRSGQQAARLARARALCDAARIHGARFIAMAHTADDQAETVLMRASAGSTWRGLAGIAPMAPAPVWPQGRGIMLARPLLHVRRADLRGVLRARGADWVEDPANANPRFERVRVRARLAALEAQGFDPMRLVRLAAHLRPRADQLDRAARALIASATRFDGERILVAAAQWRGEGEVRRRALSVLLAAAAGAAREPPAAALERLDARLAAGDFRGACLGGAHLVQRGGDIIISRDPGALRGRADGALAPSTLPLEAGVEAVWDGRLALVAAAPGWSVEVERGQARLAKGQTRLPAQEWSSAARVNWLLEARIAHLLG